LKGVQSLGYPLFGSNKKIYFKFINIFLYKTLTESKMSNFLLK
jgi:hypothetical protein